MQLYLSPMFRTLTAAVVAVFLAAASYAIAAGGGWVSSENSQARLIAVEESVGGRGILTIGIHVRMEEGWETYWRSPGDAGVPPTFDWSASANVAETRIEWPVPDELVTFGMTTYGYRGEVVFPVLVAVEDVSRPVSLRLTFGYAVCREVCIPVEAELALDVPATGGEPGGAFAALIDRFRALVPGEPTFAGMSVERVTMSTGAASSLEILVRAGEPLKDPHIILEGPPGIAYGEPSIRLLAGGRRAILILAIEGSEEARRGLLNSEVMVTLIDQGRAIERALLVESAD